MRPIPTKRVLCAAALAAVLAAPAGAQAPPASGINLRDYWILAEIVNPTTGARAAFRVDCSDQSPLLCKGGRSPLVFLNVKLSQQCGHDFTVDQRPLEWPEFINADVEPFFPGIVGYLASGAGGFAAGSGRLGSLLSRPAPFSELRRPGGFSIPISSTGPDCKRIEKSDVRLTMWLVTPEELAARDAGGELLGAAEGKPAKAAKPAFGRAPRR